MNMRAFRLFSILIAATFTHGVMATLNPLKETLDLPYYEHGALKESDEARLNIVLPEGIEDPPVLVWIGQGAWAYVSRAVEINLCRQIAKQGIVVVSVGHRLSPALLSEPKSVEGVQHPEHIKDIAASIKWLIENSETHGFDVSNLFVGGYSSGAHLSALLVSDERYLEAHGLSTDAIRGIIPVAGGYDIPAYRDVLVAADPSFDENHIVPVFGDTDSQIDASPSNYIESFNSPALFISERDTYDYTRFFEDLLIEHGKEQVTIVHARDHNHAELWRELSGDSRSVYRDLIVSFIYTHAEANSDENSQP
jgi:dienelactone hydrolase